MSELAVQLNTIPYESNDVIYNEVSISDRDGRLANRGGIETYQKTLEELLGSDRGEMDEINENGLKEYFVEGSYTRELFIPKNVTIISKLWNRERLWIIAQGEVTFTTELGIQRIKAPYVGMAPSGSKVALFAHEDTLWFAVTGIKPEEEQSAEESLSAEDYSGCVYPWDKLEQEGEIK